MTPVAKHPDCDQTNKPYQLVLAGPDDHGVSGEKSERNADVAEGDGDLHDLAKVECHTGKSLQDGKVSATMSPEAEVEKKGSLNVTDELHKGGQRTSLNNAGTTFELTHRVRCLTWAKKDSGTEPY